MGWSNTTEITDEGFHPRNDDPWWNESSFLTFRLPDRELLGILYFYFRPNQNTAMGGPILIDPTGDELSTCRHTGWGWHMPIPEGADMFDFALASSFSCQTIQPQRSYRHTYDGAGCGFDLTYVADGPPMAMASEGGGLSDFVGATGPDISSGHFEQFGIISGTLQLDGETIELHDAPTFRDRSWGPRPVLQHQDKTRGALVFARANSEHAFQAWAMSPLPWRDDPVLGTTENIASGFYVKDGVIGAITTGTRRVIDRSPTGQPIHEIVHATDEHGRALYAEGRVTVGLRWPGLYGDVMALWCLEHWTLDGVPAPGEVQEWFMCRQFADWRRRGIST